MGRGDDDEVDKDDSDDSEGDDVNVEDNDDDNDNDDEYDNEDDDDNDNEDDNVDDDDHNDNEDDDDDSGNLPFHHFKSPAVLAIKLNYIEHANVENAICDPHECSSFFSLLPPKSLSTEPIKVSPQS